MAPLPGTVPVVPKHPGRYAGVVNMVAGGLSLALGGILIGATSQCHGELCWLPGLITGGLFVGAGGGGLTAGLVLVAASGRSQEASTIYLATHAPTQLDAGEHARAMRKARRGAIVSGVAALAGLALAGGGAGLWKAWDNIIHNDAKPYPTDEEKVEAGRLWPAGTALVTIGLATFLPSFIAMSVELARYRTLKRVGAGRGVTLSARPPTPWVTRDGGGVAVAGSF